MKNQIKSRFHTFNIFDLAMENDIFNLYKLAGLCHFNQALKHESMYFELLKEIKKRVDAIRKPNHFSDRFKEELAHISQAIENKELDNIHPKFYMLIVRMDQYRLYLQQQGENIQIDPESILREKVKDLLIEYWGYCKSYNADDSKITEERFLQLENNCIQRAIKLIKEENIQSDPENILHEKIKDLLVKYWGYCKSYNAGYGEMKWKRFSKLENLCINRGIKLIKRGK